jgi:hypothetical protein
MGDGTARRTQRASANNKAKGKQGQTTLQRARNKAKGKQPSKGHTKKEKGKQQRSGNQRGLCVSVRV